MKTEALRASSGPLAGRAGWKASLHQSLALGLPQLWGRSGREGEARGPHGEWTPLLGLP